MNKLDIHIQREDKHDAASAMRLMRIVEDTLNANGWKLIHFGAADAISSLQRRLAEAEGQCEYWQKFHADLRAENERLREERDNLLERLRVVIGLANGDDGPPADEWSLGDEADAVKRLRAELAQAREDFLRYADEHRVWCVLAKGDLVDQFTPCDCGLDAARARYSAKAEEAATQQHEKDQAP